MRKHGALLLVLFFVASLLVSLGAGRYPLNLGDVARLLASGLGMAPPPAETQLIFWNIRLPASS